MGEELPLKLFLLSQQTVSAQNISLCSVRAVGGFAHPVASDAGTSIADARVLLPGVCSCELKLLPVLLAKFRAVVNFNDLGNRFTMSAMGMSRI